MRKWAGTKRIYEVDSKANGDHYIWIYIYQKSSTPPLDNPSERCFCVGALAISFLFSSGFTSSHIHLLFYTKLYIDCITTHHPKLTIGWKNFRPVKLAVNICCWATEDINWAESKHCQVIVQYPQSPFNILCQHSWKKCFCLREPVFWGRIFPRFPQDFPKISSKFLQDSPKIFICIYVFVLNS